MSSHSDEDTLRILVATDNHLGVWESDPIRSHDSFETFEEIFKIARDSKVDFVLLGGDLFHENKPSRSTVVKTMNILNKYCFHDGEVSFDILSDQKENFTTGRANYLNPNYNIGLPVFTIHGNHDDPSTSDNISAVDILASSNLVNYFGKVAIQGTYGTGKIRLQPILMRKGKTHLALYGLGNIRDERLCRLFNSPQGVEWARPTSTETIDTGDWVNLFVLHQNRVAHVKGAKNIVKESHLPKFLDIVVWGHEHECIQMPWESIEAGRAFSVIQPGSSVATALSEGESKHKHVSIIEIQGKRWRSIQIPLETVRPFAFDTVVLARGKDVSPGDPDSVRQFLERKVDEMIVQSTKKKNSRSPELPLIRCRVDYTGFSTINTQQLAHKYVNKVANPQDILLWQKEVVRRKLEKQQKNGPVSIPVATEETKIEDLINENLTEKLKVLPENELADALNAFVRKDEKEALVLAVHRVLQETSKAATKQPLESENDGETEIKAIKNAISIAVEQRCAAQAAKNVLHNAAKVRTAALSAANASIAPVSTGNNGNDSVNYATPGEDRLPALDKLEGKSLSNASKTSPVSQSITSTTKKKPKSPELETVDLTEAPDSMDEMPESDVEDGMEIDTHTMPAATAINHNSKSETLSPAGQGDRRLGAKRPASNLQRQTVKGRLKSIARQADSGKKGSHDTKWGSMKTN